MIEPIMVASDTIKNGRTLKDIALKLSEETGEVAKAINKNEGKKAIVEECCDVILCAVDLIFQSDDEITPTEIESVVTRKVAKWRELYGETV